MLGGQRYKQMFQPLVLFHVKWHRSNSNSVTWDVVSEFKAIVVRGSSTLARPCLFSSTGSQLLTLSDAGAGHPTMLGCQRCKQISQPLVLVHVKCNWSNSNSVTWDVVSEFEAIVVRGSSTLARPCLFSSTGSQLLMLSDAAMTAHQFQGVFALAY